MSRSVHFSSAPPHVIEGKKSISSSVNRNIANFSGEDRKHRLLLIGKLLAIYSIPVILLLTQSGTFLALEFNTRALSRDTETGLSRAIAMGTEMYLDTQSKCENIDIDSDTMDVNFKSSIREALIGADEGGEIWKYFILFESFIEATWTIEKQTCILIDAAGTNLLNAERKEQYEENRVGLRVLLQLGSQRLDRRVLDNSSISATLENFNSLQTALDKTFIAILAANTSGNTTLASPPDISLEIPSSNLTGKLNKLKTHLTDGIVEVLFEKLEFESARVERYYHFGISILCVSAFICPLLAFLYVRSMNTMSALIRGYATHMILKSAEVSYEKKNTERILHQMLPPTVATALIEQKSQRPETYESVTIFFSDIEGFEELVEESKPLQVVDWLNAIYYLIDNEIEKVDAYKVETIGDAYMVVSGLPKTNENRHAGELASFSLRLMEIVPFHARELVEFPLNAVRLRIGLHSGTCVAGKKKLNFFHYAGLNKTLTGVIGTKMPRFCLFGDTINTASRMKTHGQALAIHMSDSTRMILDELGGYLHEPRGEIDVKGKGTMFTHWLLGKEGHTFKMTSIKSVHVQALAAS